MAHQYNLRSLPLDHEGRSVAVGTVGSQSETELAVEHHDVEVSSTSSDQQLVIDEENAVLGAPISSFPAATSVLSHTTHTHLVPVVCQGTTAILLATGGADSASLPMASSSRPSLALSFSGPPAYSDRPAVSQTPGHSVYPACTDITDDGQYLGTGSAAATPSARPASTLVQSAGAQGPRILRSAYPVH